MGNFDECMVCKPPKRHPGCQDHCPEHKKAKAAFEASKAAYAQARGRSIGTVYAQRADAVNRATRRGRR